MKIVRRTESELVAADSGLFLCGLFMSVAVPLLYLGALPGRHKMLFGAAFMLLCSGICLRKTTFIFDRVRGIAFWRRRRMFKVDSGEIPFSDISDIGFDTMQDQRGVTTYRLMVITAMSRVPMADMYGGGRKYYESVRDSIVEFLAGSGTPVHASPGGGWDDEASLRAMILEGRKLDAIALLRAKENLDLLHAKERIEEIDRQMRQSRNA
ncbi:MAG TPA: hypothetical protein VHD85_05705 [Terracidiphilus sp.]|nr:hypothetical protein [Terracidiphilus sp.]